VKPSTHTANVKLKRWMEKASPMVRAALLSAAKTKDSMLRQWASGRRSCSADLAGRVEVAMQGIQRDFVSAPAALNRGDLCPACRKCPYLIEALKKEGSKEEHWGEEV
jgi:hypothetical protein